MHLIQRGVEEGTASVLQKRNLADGILATNLIHMYEGIYYIYLIKRL